MTYFYSSNAASAYDSPATPPVPSAAVQITRDILRQHGLPAYDEIPDSVVAALAEAALDARLREAVAALRAKTDPRGGVPWLEPELGAVYAALDGVPAETESGEVCGSWPLGWNEGESVSCILPRGHPGDTCRSQFGGEWRRVPERTPIR